MFGVAAAAFAWTTLRVHDRQMAAEENEKAVAFLLGTPGLQTSEQPAAGGGSVTAFYSAKLRPLRDHRARPPLLGSGQTYQFVVPHRAGSAPKEAGDLALRHPAERHGRGLAAGRRGVAGGRRSSRPGGVHTLSGTPIAELTLG